MEVLITGFSPFDGRLRNASWVAAQSLQTQPYVSVLELPVVWGAPRIKLQPVCETACPSVIIGMGEGKEGAFAIETVAQNARASRRDNLANLPFYPLIDPQGPTQQRASVDADRLHQYLTEKHWPVRVSTTAGAFLCEETLYTLESLRAQHEPLKTVLFVHLPSYGSQLQVNQVNRRCDTQLLSAFAAHLHRAVLDIHAQTHGNT